MPRGSTEQGSSEGWHALNRCPSPTKQPFDGIDDPTHRRKDFSFEVHGVRDDSRRRHAGERAMDPGLGEDGRDLTRQPERTVVLVDHHHGFTPTCNVAHRGNIERRHGAEIDHGAVGAPLLQFRSRLHRPVCSHSK